MAKYFSTCYLKKTDFQEGESHVIKEQVLKFINTGFLTIITYLVIIRPMKFSSLATGISNQIISSSIESQILPPLVQKSISIKFLAEVQEEDISKFLADVYEHLTILGETSAYIDLEYQDQHVVGVNINNISSNNNLKAILNEIHASDNVVIKIN
jgi:hypothetical protein